MATEKTTEVRGCGVRVRQDGAEASCGRPVLAHGMCSGHYMRARRIKTGKPAPAMDVPFNRDARVKLHLRVLPATHAWLSDGGDEPAAVRAGRMLDELARGSK